MNDNHLRAVPLDRPQPERDLDWLVTRFVDDVPDAAHAILVSADGSTRVLKPEVATS